MNSCRPATEYNTSITSNLATTDSSATLAEVISHQRLCLLLHTAQLCHHNKRLAFMITQIRLTMQVTWQTSLLHNIPSWYDKIMRDLMCVKKQTEASLVYSWHHTVISVHRVCPIRWTRPMACISWAEFSTGSTSSTWVAWIKLRPFAPEWIGNRRTLTSRSALKLWRFSWITINLVQYCRHNESQSTSCNTTNIMTVTCHVYTADSSTSN